MSINSKHFIAYLYLNIIFKLIKSIISHKPFDFFTNNVYNVQKEQHHQNRIGCVSYV